MIPAAILPVLLCAQLAAATPPPPSPGYTDGSIVVGTIPAFGPGHDHLRLLLVHGREVKLPVTAVFDGQVLRLNGVGWDFSNATDGKYEPPQTPEEKRADRANWERTARRVPGGTRALARGVLPESVLAQGMAHVRVTAEKASDEFRKALGEGEEAATRAAAAALDTTWVDGDLHGEHPPHFLPDGKWSVFMKGMGVQLDNRAFPDDAHPPAPRPLPTLDRATSLFQSMKFYFTLDADIIVELGGTSMGAYVGGEAQKCAEELRSLHAAALAKRRLPPPDGPLPAAIRREVLAVDRGWVPGS